LANHPGARKAEKVNPSKSLLSLINGILEITKIETGGASLNLDPSISMRQHRVRVDMPWCLRKKTWRELAHANLPDVTYDRIKLRG
jgi:hypothetical protein